MANTVRVRVSFPMQKPALPLSKSIRYLGVLVEACSPSYSPDGDKEVSGVQSQLGENSKKLSQNNITTLFKLLCHTDTNLDPKERRKESTGPLHVT